MDDMKYVNTSELDIYNENMNNNSAVSKQLEKHFVMYGMDVNQMEY